MNQQQDESFEDLQGQLTQLLERIEAKKLNAQNVDSNPAAQQHAPFAGFQQHAQNVVSPARRAPMARSQSNMGYSSHAVGPALMVRPALLSIHHEVLLRVANILSHRPPNTPVTRHPGGNGERSRSSPTRHRP
jgi:hypothetical protein